MMFPSVQHQVELKAEDGAKVSDNRSSPEMKAKIDPIVGAENDDMSLHSIPGIVDTNLRKNILQVSLGLLTLFCFI